MTKKTSKVGRPKKGESGGKIGESSTPEMTRGLEKLLSRQDEFFNYIKLGATREQIRSFFNIGKTQFHYLIKHISKSKFNEELSYDELIERVGFIQKIAYKESLIEFAKKTPSPDFRWKIWLEFFGGEEKSNEVVSDEPKTQVIINDISKLSPDQILKLGSQVSANVSKKIDEAITSDLENCDD